MLRTSSLSAFLPPSFPSSLPPSLSFFALVLGIELNPGCSTAKLGPQFFRFLTLRRALLGRSTWTHTPWPQPPRCLGFQVCAAILLLPGPHLLLQPCSRWFTAVASARQKHDTDATPPATAFHRCPLDKSTLSRKWIQYPWSFGHAGLAGVLHGDRNTRIGPQLGEILYTKPW